MSDYIERKSIRNLYSCLNPEDKVRVEQVLTDIDAIPTLDAVEVVRCKDCKYWIGELTEDQEDTFVDECRWRTDEQTYSYDFCSYGERKETDDE